MAVVAKTAFALATELQQLIVDYHQLVERYDTITATLGLPEGAPFDEVIKKIRALRLIAASYAASIEKI